MDVLCFSLGQLQTNCYFLIKEGNCLIIDPADEASFILEQIQRRNLKLLGLFATHGHFDHLMAVGAIQQSFNIPLYISSKDLFLLDRLEETAKYFLKYKPILLPIKNIKNLESENFLKIKNFKFKILFTPGHTPGSLSFCFSEEKVIFTGDTLFKKAVGRFDFSYSSRDDLKKSLKKIFSLPKNTIVYPGHGDRTTLAEEKSTFYDF